MKKLYFLLFLLPVAAAFWGCNIINPHEKTPVYVHIDSVHFVPKANVVPGTSSQKITGVYVFFNNTTIGVFTLPATIPILSDTPGVVSILPAVPYDGINGEQQDYPFFSTDTMTIQPLPAHVYQFNPKTSYTTGSNEASPIDFETGNDTSLFFSLNATTGLTIETNPTKVFEGSRSGAIYLDSSTALSDLVCSYGIQYPTGTQEAYLELNYKCNTSFAVGLYSYDPSGYVDTYITTFVAHPDSWNKAYIDLKSILTLYPTDKQAILIHAQPDAGLSNAYVLLDNIRIVYY